jgi:hypothetical protein
MLKPGYARRARRWHLVGAVKVREVVRVTCSGVRDSQFRWHAAVCRRCFNGSLTFAQLAPMRASLGLSVGSLQFVLAPMPASHGSQNVR